MATRTENTEETPSPLPPLPGLQDPQRFSAVASVGSLLGAVSLTYKMH